MKVVGVGTEGFLNVLCMFNEDSLPIVIMNIKNTTLFWRRQFGWLEINNLGGIFLSKWDNLGD